MQLPPCKADFIPQCHTKLPAAEEIKHAQPFAAELVLLPHPTFTMKICANFLCGLTAGADYKKKSGGEEKKINAELVLSSRLSHFMVWQPGAQSCFMSKSQAHCIHGSSASTQLILPLLL